MKSQCKIGFLDIEIGDLVGIEGKVGKLYDIRFIQQVRDNIAWFECQLEGGQWVNADEVQVLTRRRAADAN